MEIIVSNHVSLKTPFIFTLIELYATNLVAPLSTQKVFELDSWTTHREEDWTGWNKEI